MLQRKDGWKLAVLGIILAAFASGFALLAEAPPAQQKNYVGGDTCLACHDIEEAFAKKSESATSLQPSRRKAKARSEVCAPQPARPAATTKGITINGEMALSLFLVWFLGKLRAQSWK